MTALLALLLQTAAAAAPAPSADTTEWSILHDPCAAARNDEGKDIVVCGNADAIEPRLPLPQYRGPPDHPVASNPELSAVVALNGRNGRAECGAYGEGCPVGGGGYAVPALVNGAIGLAQNGFKKRHYKNKGVSIPLDDPPPAADPGRPSP